MELPPKALFALVDIKSELLSRQAIREEPRREPKPVDKPSRTFKQRHARGSNAFQRGCQRRAFWSPH